MVYILSIVSVVIGISGLVYAIWERNARARLNQLLDNYIFRIMEQIQSMIVYRDDINNILKNVNDPVIREWAIEMNKGLSDLYRTSVDHFLATRSIFTFNDLEYLVKSGVVTTYWEESVWRSCVCPRSENIKNDPPEYFLENNSKRRHKYFAKNTTEQVNGGDDLKGRSSS